MEPSTSPASNDTRRAALQLAIGYALFSILWIILSTALLSILPPNLTITAIFQTVKDWLFALISAIGLFYFVPRMFRPSNLPVKPQPAIPLVEPDAADLMSPEQALNHRKK